MRRVVSHPKRPISALPRYLSPVSLASEPFRVEPAVTGFDWPFTTIPKSKECFARQQLAGPPSLVRATSSCPGIDQPASGFTAVTSGPIKTLPLTKKCCGLNRFPSDYKAKHFLASPQQKTPWPVFQNGRYDTSPSTSYYNVTIDSFSRLHSLHAISGYHYLVSGSFHPPKGFFSAFPHGTTTLSVLRCI